jgi:hypothetical protein
VGNPDLVSSAHNHSLGRNVPFLADRPLVDEATLSSLLESLRTSDNAKEREGDLVTDLLLSLGPQVDFPSPKLWW